MTRKKIILTCLLLFSFIFGLTNLAPTTNASLPAEEEAGYALLDSLVVAFKELAEKREGVMGKTNIALKEMMKKARTAKWQNQIDAHFFKRYTRILMVLKIIVLPVDDGGILKSLHFREINKFIEDIEGEKFDIEQAGSGKEAINKFSQAVSHELINLRVYLDNKEQRQKLEENYREEMALGKPATGMAVEKDKQLMSMRNIAITSQAISDYVKDHGVSPKQSGSFDRNSPFYKALSPFYIKVIPEKDGWGNNILVFSGKAGNGLYKGIKGCTDKDFIVVSFGRDGKKDSWKYDPKNPGAGLYVLESLDDFDRDLIIWNGNWIKAPKSGKKK